MNQAETDLNATIFSKQPSYVEKDVRKAFAKLMPLRTIVIYCYDPRATGVPDAVAQEFDEVYPGEVQKDADGNDIGTSTTLLNVVVAGGRAMDALRSITVGQHLLGVENIVVVHHTHCGATSYTADGIIDAYKHEHGVDISDLYPRESVCITDFDSSLKYDTQLIRNSAGTPKHVNIFGYVYDIDTHKLTKIVEDLAQARTDARVASQVS